MSYSRRRKPPVRRLLVAGALLAGLSCSRAPRPAVERLAVLPFENLTGEAGLDWMGRGVALVLAHDLTPLQDVRPLAIEALREAYPARATRVVHGYLTLRQGRLRMYASIEDLARKKSVREITVSGAVADGVIPPADRLARSLSRDARLFSTQNDAALKDFEEGMRASDAKTAGEAFERALGRDANFGPAYVAWAERLAGAGDRAGAERVLDLSRRPGVSLPTIERAELNSLGAALVRDQRAQLGFMREIARLTPANSELLVTLAESLVRQRSFAAAVETYTLASRADPSNGNLWNNMGYAQAYAGDADGAVGSLREYQRLAPDNVNPLDSLGEVSFHLGRFADAERYFLECQEKNAVFLGGAALWKAAQASLMLGELARADEHFNRYLEIRRRFHDPIENYRRAQWEYLSGRRRQARQRLAALAAQGGDEGPYASAQLAVWKLLAGDREGARADALRAAQPSGNPSTRALAGLCVFLTEPPASTEEWALRAERAFPEAAQTSLKRHALAYALLIDGHFRDAALVLKEIFEQFHPAPGGDTPVLMGWALMASGRAREAEPWLARYPIPESAGEHFLGYLAFPRLFELRAKLAEAQGRRREAARDYALFRKYSAE